MNKSKGRQGNKEFTKQWNNRRRDDRPKKEEHYLDKFKASIEVRNGDVGKALRVLKRKLEKSDFQKEMAKQQYYEKPSEKRARAKAAGIARQKKELRRRMLEEGF